MKSILGKLLSFFYSLVSSITETASTGSSILVSRKPGNFTRSDYAIAYSTGTFTGVNDFITTYCFLGAEIRKRFKDNDDDMDAALEIFVHGDISKQRKIAYLVLKYSYIVSDLYFNYLAVNLLYSATKAWFQNLQTGEDAPLAFISPTENVLVLLYYLSLDLPLIITAEIWQTCKEMENLFDIPHEYTPDKKIMDFLAKLARPLAQSRACRKFIRGSGSIADTLEHVLPLALIVPASWVLKIARSNALLSGGAFVSAAAIIALISGTVLSQTYLFEGKFSEENLKRIANQFGKEIKDDEPWVSPGVSKIFHRLLYLGGILHGIDIGFSLSLTLRELESPESIVYFCGIIASLVAWMGNHYSEVKESQESLAKITLETEEEALQRIRMLPYKTKSHFHENPNYGATQNSRYKQEPDFVDSLDFSDDENENILRM